MAGIFFSGGKSEPADKAEGSICMVWVCENWDGFDFPNSADTKDRNPITAKPPPSAQWLWETASTIRIEAAPWQGFAPIFVASVVLSWIVIGPVLMSHKAEDKALRWAQKPPLEDFMWIAPKFSLENPGLSHGLGARVMKTKGIFSAMVAPK
ncbi:hypothetical protein [Pseudogemmobacter faecipullorum]|uniref:Uncharacterized protein n=1 Tax=Pseudogemmobacter faecipullorum TaxID=2755041 RepID=A0ABS8CLL8_9RHOB|nr:hypothetical protein [Pseudogemmobacter faecipullorum]MCB5410296.1 hypothetical protein [Pseudogemmobacter faecipullorum]